MTVQGADVDAVTRCASPRRRLRFSVLNLALLLTIAALGIGLYRAGQEVVPLRETVRRLREEMGHFNVDDESRIHVQQVSTKLPNAWKWRVFLPPRGTYRLRYFCGETPAPESVGRDEWFRVMRDATSVSTFDGSLLSMGDFGLEALLTEYDGNWFLRWGRVQDDGVTLALPPSAGWVNDETAWVVTSDASLERVESFDAESSVVLLHIEPKSSRGDTSVGANDVGADVGEDARPQIVIWIDPARPPHGHGSMRP